MMTSRLRRISLLFPKATADERAFFETMERLYSQVPSVAVQAGQILLAPTYPPKALPITSLQSVDVEYPQVVFEAEELIDLRIGSLHLRSSIVPGQHSVFSDVESPAANGRLLPVAELCRRLEGRVRRADHVGVNIPQTKLDRGEWDRLRGTVGSISVLYRCPDNENWLFVLPTSQEEFQDEIRDFVLGREPKFELVYDDKAKVPLFQFSVETGLSRAESEELFPGPSGVALEDVGEFFRSVFVANPWPGLMTRFDLYYCDCEADWATGKLLATPQGRIRPASGRS